MNGRELLLDAISGKKTYRIPIVPFIYENFISEQNNGKISDTIKSGITLYKKYGFDIILRNYIISDYLDESLNTTNSWIVQKHIIGQFGENWSEKTIVTTPERVLKQEKTFRRISPYEIVEAVTEYYIKEQVDFEQFKKFQPPLGIYDCMLVTEARKAVGNDGLTGPWVQGAFNMLGMHRDLAYLLIDPFTDENFYKEMMEHFIVRVIGFIKQVIRAGADFISLSGNMASGKMAGPKYFKEFVMPYEMRVIDAIHQEGAKIIYHNCGDANELLPFYAQMNIDMFETLTAPPYGDVILEDAFKKIPLPTTLSGGIDQIDFLIKATPLQVKERVQEVLALAKKRGGFILATSDYLCEKTPEANLYALSEAGKLYGKY